MKILERIDRQQPRVSFAYSGAVLLAALVYIGVRAGGLGRQSWKVLALLALAMCAAELLSVPLPRGKARVSIGLSIVVAAVLLLGPGAAAIVAGTGVLLANLFQQKALDVILFNGAQLALSAGVTGEVWVLLGGQPGDPESLVFPHEFLPILMAIGAYVIANSTLALSGIALAERISFAGVWASNFGWAIPNFLALGSLGVLLAAVYYSKMSLYGVALIWVPLLVARYSFKQYVQLRDAQLETIRALALALDAKDPNTRGHSERVARWAAAIARTMRLPDSDVELIEHAGVLHDIGKIAIKDAVLHKVGGLTADERQLVEAHPAIGASIIQKVPCLQKAVELIRHHHERFDGRGYPAGLIGATIPLGARILAVADAFDAMSMDRSYRRGLSFEEAIAQLWEGRGKQFDPDIVELFVMEVLRFSPEQREPGRKDWETVRRSLLGAG